MVISKKPKEKNIDDKLIDQILTRGGSVAQSKREPENENIKNNASYSKKMLHTIDSFLKTSIYSKPRNVWIKGAIEKKSYRYFRKKIPVDLLSES